MHVTIMDRSIYYFLPPSLAPHPPVLSDKVDIDKHLELGKKFLQEGQLSEALTHYTAACGKDHHTYKSV